MRGPVAAGSIVLLVLVLSAAAPARTNDDVRETALRTVRTNVDDAIKLELSALHLAGHGNEAGAKQELRNAEQLLEGAYPAADTLTPPLDLRRYVPDNGWERLGRNIRSAEKLDAEAVARGGDRLHSFVLLALAKKKDIFDLVNKELTHPLCSTLVDLRGPITVNGAPQGHAQLSIDVSCTAAIKRIVIDTPKNAVTMTAADGAAKAAAAKSANVVQVVMNGATSGGVTESTSPDPAAGSPVLVEIVGDSVEYVPETM